MVEHKTLSFNNLTERHDVAIKLKEQPIVTSILDSEKVYIPILKSPADMPENTIAEITFVLQGNEIALVLDHLPLSGRQNFKMENLTFEVQLNLIETYRDDDHVDTACYEIEKVLLKNKNFDNEIFQGILERLRFREEIDSRLL
jgi:hypothetical protein